MTDGAGASGGGVVDRQVDVLVVGAGPAGIAAATAAAGASGDVLLIDDNPLPGGQIWRGGAGAAESLRRLAATCARVETGTAVVAVAPGPVVVVRGPAGLQRIAATRVVLATGARERFVPFPGWTLPGVTGAGGLQALIKQGFDVAGKRVVIAGSGPLLLAVGRLVVERGGRLLAIAEQADRRRLGRFAAGLCLEPGKLLEAVALGRAIGPVLRLATVPMAARVAEDALVVTLRRGAAGRARDELIACDLLACGFGLLPNTEVARMLGCAVDATGIRVDDRQRTSVGGIFAAGECTGIGGLDKSLAEGRLAGLAAVDRQDTERSLVASVRRARRFAARLARAFQLDPRVATLASAETIVCRCEDVPLGSIRGCAGWREAKLLTRLGMGPCQGRVCGGCTDVLFGWGPDEGRPPLVPMPIGSLARWAER